MEMWKEIFSIVISNGIFAVLFVLLFFYQLKDSAKREQKYQKTIEELTTGLRALEDMKDDIEEIKDMLEVDNL